MRTIISSVDSDEGTESVVVDNRRLLKYLLIYGGLTFIAGSVSLMVVDLLSSTKVPPCATCEPAPFTTTCLLQVIQCIGETLCLGVYAFDKYALHESRALNFHLITNTKLPPARWYHWLGPGIMDSLGTFTIFAALFFLNSNIVHIVQCSGLLLTAISCIVLFKRDIRVTSWIGLLFITAGQIWSSAQGSSKAGLYSNATVGAMMLAVGIVLTSMFYVYAEFLWTRYSFNPIYGVGLYGFIATLLSLLILMIAHFVGFENAYNATYQLFHSPRLIGLTILFMLDIALLNVATLTASGLGSALFTATVLTARSAPAWLFEITYGATPITVMGALSMACITLGFVFYANLFQYCLPSSVAKWLCADLTVRCKILLDDDDEMMQPIASSTMSSESATEPRKTKSRKVHSTSKSTVPMIAGEMFVTRNSTEFYTGSENNDFRVYVQKDFELSDHD